MNAETESGWFTATLGLPHDEAIDVVTAALKKEGFGVLTRADLHDAFREKLGVEFRPYTILGACNPPLALQALNAAPEIGLFLPCNVTVEASDGGSLVRLSDPRAVLAGAGVGVPEGMESVAEEARTRIERVTRALESGSAPA